MRKYLILILLLIPSLCFGNDAALIMGKAPTAISTICGKAIAGVSSFAGAGVAAAVCTIGSGDNWVNADNSDYTTIDDYTEDFAYQAAANAASKNICSIKIYLYRGGSAPQMTVKLKSAVGGTLYGTSDTVTLTEDSSMTQKTFTFSPSVTVPGNFIVSLIVNQPTRVYLASGASKDNYFGGADYSGIIDNVDTGADWAMEIWYEQ